MRELLNDCRYCDNKGSNCVRHKDVAERPTPDISYPPPGGVFLKDWLREGGLEAYTSVSDSLIGGRVIREEVGSDS